MSACYSQEPQAPARAFKPEDLLIGEEVIAPAWQASDAFLPAGDELATSESAAVYFRAADTNGESRVLAEHAVYRYIGRGVAQRVFDKVYLPQTRSLNPVGEWTYQSPIADQSHFGCRTVAGTAEQVCVWAGRYEEFIVVFRSHILPGEMSLAGMETVIQAIDGIMASHLGRALPSEEPMP